MGHGISDLAVFHALKRIVLAKLSGIDVPPVHKCDGMHLADLFRIVRRLGYCLFRSENQEAPVFTFVKLRKGGEQPLLQSLSFRIFVIVDAALGFEAVRNRGKENRVL